MALISLSEVQNDYGSYRGNSLVGELGSVVTVPNDGLEDIIGVNNANLNGIILQIEGNLYTDAGYLNALKALGNPYISKRSLPIISLKLSELTEELPDQEVYEGVYRTQYAESNVSRRMSSVDDILLYLNDFFDEDTTGDVVAVESIGSFELSTTSYSVDADIAGTYPGLEFETVPGHADGSVVTISTPPTTSEPKKVQPKVEVIVPEEKPLVVIAPKIDPFEPIDVIPISSNPAQNFSTVGTSSTFGSYNYGYGYTNGAAAAEVAMQAMQPKKPNFTGTYTGQSAVGPDGSRWVWIPFQGGWTSA